MSISTAIVSSVADALAAGTLIRVSDRAAFGLAGVPMESLLDEIVASRPCLLHGTGDIIAYNSPLKLKPGRLRGGITLPFEAFGTDLASVALLKALFSNQFSGVNLRYSYGATRTSGLPLRIEGWRPEVDREVGYVYLLGPRDWFVKEGSTWQWVTTHADVHFAGGVEIIRGDFVHPVVRA